jgi:serine/threonine protein kinase
MLEDFTVGKHTHLYWYDDHGDEQDNYRLQGDPRRRVIPQAPAGQIIINFGADAVFQFVWRQPTFPATLVEQSKAELARIAQENVMLDPTALLSVPRDPKLLATAYEDVSAKTPQVPKEFDGRPLRPLHMCKEIGLGGFGKVFKAVDLATGSLWAVKVCRRRGNKGHRESWKTPLLKEVEKLAQLQHVRSPLDILLASLTEKLQPRIIRLEHHQGWSEGRPVQIFFPICDGSVRNLLPRCHRCKEKSSVQEPWLAAFIDQVLSGLTYIHQNNMVHRDLKPENILFNRGAGPTGEVCSFYISDFGLVTHVDTLKRSSKDLTGTRYYLAPETTLHGEYSTASDIYAFAVMLLEILGIYCPEEGDMALEEWRKKLRAYGVREYKKYCDIFPAKAIEKTTQGAHSRVQSLVDYGLVRSPMPRLLQQDPRRRATALEAHQDLLATYGSRGNALQAELSLAERASDPPRTELAARPPPIERVVKLPAEPALRRRSTAWRFELPTRPW